MRAIAAIALSLACGGCSGDVMDAPAPAPVPAHAAPTFVAEYILPEASEEIGGLSGAWYDDRARRLWTISDGRDRPQFVVFDVGVDRSLQVTMREIIPLQLPDGADTLDAEGLAPGRNGHLFVSSEGNPRSTSGPAPGIFEFDRNGRFIRRLALPEWYAGGGDTDGFRSNRGLESLTVSPDGAMLYAATESSLRQDGAQADSGTGAIVRILAYDLSRGTPPREYAYRTEPVRAPEGFAGATGNNGVSELLALGGNKLFVLERGFVQETAPVVPRGASTVRVYRVRLTTMSEVTGRRALDEDTPVLDKTLALDAASAAPMLSDALKSLENFEGMTFGPHLMDGSRSLLLVSDDNFSDRQVTAFLLFRLP